MSTLTGTPESENEEDASSSWKDIVLLLRGGLEAGSTASKLLADVVIPEEEVPEIFHELCTNFAVDTEWMTRVNAGRALHGLCAKHVMMLLPLATVDHSDGEFMTLNELDIAVLGSRVSAELSSGESSYLDINGIHNDDTKATENNLYRYDVTAHSSSHTHISLDPPLHGLVKCHMCLCICCISAAATAEDQAHVVLLYHLYDVDSFCTQHHTRNNSRLT
jgi:hypothetical protein